MNILLEYLKFCSYTQKHTEVILHSTSKAQQNENLLKQNMLTNFPLLYSQLLMALNNVSIKSVNKQLEMMAIKELSNTFAIGKSLIYYALIQFCNFEILDNTRTCPIMQVYMQATPICLNSNEDRECTSILLGELQTENKDPIKCSSKASSRIYRTQRNKITCRI